MSDLNKGIKFDGDKPRTDLISPVAILELSRVLGFGASKYAPWNWAKGILYSRVIAAVLRHIYAFMMGEDKDPESNLPHLAHAMCGLMFLLHFEKYRKQYDDRGIAAFTTINPEPAENVTSLQNYALIKEAGTVVEPSFAYSIDSKTGEVRPLRLG
jgi:hypothetical protein